MNRPPETYMIEADGHRATFAPSCGGLLFSYDVSGYQVIHCPDDWFTRYPTAIHFGNPVLFPFASKLAFYDHADVFHWRGTFHRMPQHGFARHLPWQICDLRPERIEMTLRSSKLTMVMFPWEFEFVLSYTLKDAALFCEARVTNRSEEKMPLHLGFHPYLRTELPHTRYAIIVPEARSLRLLDGRGRPVQTENRDINLNSSLSMTRFYEDVNPSCFSLLDRETGKAVTLRASAEFFRHWAVWRPRLDSPFVCIEPWSAPPNALNSGESLLWVEPGQSQTALMMIKHESATDLSQT
jgi:galactose mutarotase-like enzyme